MSVALWYHYIHFANSTKISMIRKLIRSLALPIAILVATGITYAKMSDQQVIDYVKTSAAQGKSKQQIGRELLARGVTEDQLRRIQQMEEHKQTNSDVTGTAKNAYNAVRHSDAVKNEITIASEEEVPVEVVNGETVAKVYGRDIFRSRSLTFEPNENVATPEDYTLGPGDEVVIDIWGNNEDQIRQTISPEGRIIVSQIGPIYLNGMTVKEANSRLKDVFASKYADVAGDGSDISLTLGQLRTIKVDIMGEVATPGTYRLSPFSTLFNALYHAGGTSPAGSLRIIEVLRNGRKIASADLYEYLFNGKRSTDIRLQEGDVIVVPSYDRLVEIEGEVKRPMTYELKKGETLADLLQYAGGMKSSAFSERVTVDRTINDKRSVAVVESADFETSRLDDGDIVIVGKVADRYENKVEVTGAVFRPGIYALGNEIQTVKDLINIAQGLTENAFMNRAQIYRESEDLTPEIVAIDLAGIMRGTSPDIPLQKNDMLQISTVEEMEPHGNVIIEGEILRPGNYPYAKNMTLEDIIFQAGGLNEGASTVKIDISRRLDDSESTAIGEKISQNYTIQVRDGLILDGNEAFIIQPNDVIDIRRSPGYVVQRRVSVSGEVPFEGTYSLEKRSERLSDLVKRAGGVSNYAYLRGAHLSRRMTPEEKIARDEMLELVRNSSGDDSISVAKLDLSDRYTVGIELDKALANPGGPEDLVLMEGDQLVVPELINTVKIGGDVLYPNTVIFTPGKKLKYYIEQAGGYGNTANKGKAFVIYMNGTIAKGKNAVIEPGCQIIVPSKQKGRTISIAEWLAIGTSAASLGTMAASIYNIVK